MATDTKEKKKRNISARIDEEVYKKTRMFVIEHDIAYEDFINRAMEKYYDECVKTKKTKADIF